jgi:predicted permease
VTIRNPDPPALTEWILRLAMSRSAADAVVGDLLEELMRRRLRGTLPRSPRLWLVGQALVHAAGAIIVRHPRQTAHQETMNMNGSRLNDGAAMPKPARHTASFFHSLRQDFRYAARLMRRNPGFTLVAGLTLALGIGANTAIFTVANAVLLRPLPFADPARLVVVGHQASEDFAGVVGYTTIHDWRNRSRSFDTLAVIRGWTATANEPGEPERIAAMRVSWNYFRMLGVRPALGRAFEPADDRPDTRYVVILSHGLWQRRFGSDPHVIGRTIQLNDRPFTIVGVMPANYSPIISAHFYQPADLWAPLGYDVSEPSACRSCQHLRALGRLAPGYSIDQAGAELNAIQASLRTAYPNEYENVPVAVTTLGYELAGRIQPVLYVLMAGVGFVLLIACANVANLLLARAAGRGTELALRAAIGASRLRLVQQLITESVLLAIFGGGVGVAVSAVVLPTLVRLAPPELAGFDRLILDRTVLAFALLLSLLTGILFGLAPAWQIVRVDVQTMLRQGARHLLGSSSSGARRALVVVDLALALVLLVGAGVMLRSVERLLDVDPGFDPSRVVTAQLAFVGKAWAEDEPVRVAGDAILDRVRALPGVESAGLTSQIPLAGTIDTWGFHIEGRMAANPAEDPSVEHYSVTPSYFQAMRIPLRRGRLFTAADTRNSLPVMIIAETTARTLWANEDPIGKRVRVPDAGNGPWRTVVGIVGDVRHYDLAERPTPQMYLPQSQVTDSYPILTIRATGDADGVAEAVRQAVWSVDKTVPIYDVSTLDARVSQSVRPRWFVMLLLSCFATISVLMAAVGVYGVVASLVSQRTREFGIRLALGAQPRDLARMLVRGGTVLTAMGVSAGAVLGAALARFLGSLTYGVSTLDPITFVACALLLGGVALAAHWMPIRHAMCLDPVDALRQD